MWKEVVTAHLNHHPTVAYNEWKQEQILDFWIDDSNSE
jgi:hypothetical protein